MTHSAQYGSENNCFNNVSQILHFAELINSLISIVETYFYEFCTSNCFCLLNRHILFIIQCHHVNPCLCSLCVFEKKPYTKCPDNYYQRPYTRETMHSALNL